MSLGHNLLFTSLEVILKHNGFVLNSIFTQGSILLFERSTPEYDITPT